MLFMALGNVVYDRPAPKQSSMVEGLVRAKMLSFLWPGIRTGTVCLRRKNKGADTDLKSHASMTCSHT